MRVFQFDFPSSNGNITIRADEGQVNKYSLPLMAEDSGYNLVELSD